MKTYNYLALNITYKVRSKVRMVMYNSIIHHSHSNSQACVSHGVHGYYVVVHHRHISRAVVLLKLQIHFCFLRENWILLFLLRENWRWFILKMMKCRWQFPTVHVWEKKDEIKTQIYFIEQIHLLQTMCISQSS